MDSGGVTRRGFRECRWLPASRRSYFRLPLAPIQRGADPPADIAAGALWSAIARQFASPTQPPFHNGIRSAGARLKFRAAAEAERLDLIVTLLRERERIVKAQRTERRIPDQAHANRGADRTGVR